MPFTLASFFPTKRLAILFFLFVILLAIPVALYIIPRDLRPTPQGTIRETLSSGEVRVWQVVGVADGGPLRFTILSGTTTELLVLSPTNPDALIGGPRTIQSDYHLLTTLGSKDNYGALACDQRQGQLRTSRDYIGHTLNGGVGMSGNIGPVRYSGDLQFHCTNPASPGSNIEGSLFFRDQPSRL